MRYGFWTSLQSNKIGLFLYGLNEVFQGDYNLFIDTNRESKNEYDQNRKNQTKIIHFLKKLMKKQTGRVEITGKEEGN